MSVVLLLRQRETLSGGSRAVRAAASFEGGDARKALGNFAEEDFLRPLLSLLLRPEPSPALYHCYSFQPGWEIPGLHAVRHLIIELLRISLSCSNFRYVCRRANVRTCRHQPCCMASLLETSRLRGCESGLSIMVPCSGDHTVKIICHRTRAVPEGAVGPQAHAVGRQVSPDAAAHRGFRLPGLRGEPFSSTCPTAELAAPDGVRPAALHLQAFV